MHIIGNISATRMAKLQICPLKMTIPINYNNNFMKTVKTKGVIGYIHIHKIMITENFLLSWYFIII